MLVFPVLQLYSCSDLRVIRNIHLCPEASDSNNPSVALLDSGALAKRNPGNGSRTASPTLPLIAVLKEPSNKRVFAQKEATLLEKKQPKPL